MSSSETSRSSADKRLTIYRVTPPGGIVYLTNALKEVLDEVNLALIGNEIRIEKLWMTRSEAEAAPNFVGRFIGEKL